MRRQKIPSLILGLTLVVCCSAFFSCARSYYGDPSQENDPVEALVPENISTVSSTKVTFSHCLFSDGLSMILIKEDDRSEVPLQVTPGTPTEEGCVTEVTFSPEQELVDQARYILSIDFPAFSYEFTVTASLILEFRPGVYMTLTGGGPLDSFSEKLRTWFVEFGEPDEDGYFDIWHVDADAPEEQNGEPICFGWSAQPSSDVGRGIGWSSHTRGVLNEDGTLFSTPEGEVMDIEVKPLVCVKGGRYEGSSIPSGGTISGKFSVESLEIPCGLPSSADQAVYAGDRCPEGTVLPHE